MHNLSLAYQKCLRTPNSYRSMIPCFMTVLNQEAEEEAREVKPVKFQKATTDCHRRLRQKDHTVMNPLV
jgi:hypothetical protein